MIRSGASILLAALAATGVRASEAIAYVIPVVTAQVNARIYTTTFAARNLGAKDASCEAVYAVPNDPNGGTLRTTYVVPADGTPIVEEDLLKNVGAVGTVRVVCSAPVAIAARIQTSADGGGLLTKAARMEASTKQPPSEEPAPCMQGAICSSRRSRGTT